MTNHKIVYEIAKWEFLRWFKVKDQMITIILSIAISLAFWGFKTLSARDQLKPVYICVVDSSGLSLSVPAESRIKLSYVSLDNVSWARQEVATQRLSGLLIIGNSDAGQLIVSKAPFWKNELEQILTSARSNSKTKQLGVNAVQLQDINRPFSLQTIYNKHGKQPAGTGEKLAAVIIICLMFFGVFMSFSYQFISITGEKQLRVTEQIVSIISPQQWIDGKILGLSLFSLVTTMTFSLSILLFFALSTLWQSGFSIPVEITNPLTVLTLIVLGIAGYFFWNTFFTAIAATINDPNTSARGGLMMLPMLPSIGVAFAALKNPDSTLMQILSIFPVTSPAVMSARLVLTEVALWEILLALVFLSGTIWLMRIAAAKTFHLGLLMYGKEPSFKEIIRWIRAA